jgi:Protein of unknown function (DUF3995)
VLLSLLLAGVLFLLSAIHLYWGFGGRWPGHDEVSMVEHVVGRTRGMKAPSLVASVAVALALAAGGGLVLAATAPPTPFEPWLKAARWALFAVFAGRGVATYVPPLFRYAEGTPFWRLNRRAYGPLCLALALGILAIQM